jgi:hypothetical protein
VPFIVGRSRTAAGHDRCDQRGDRSMSHAPRV